MAEKKTAIEQYRTVAKMIANELFIQDNVTRQVTYQNYINQFRDIINEELLNLINKAKAEELARRK